VRWLSPAKEQRIRQLLTPEEMGDRKPSRFLRDLRSLAPDVPNDFLRSIWSSRLHHNMQAVLAGQPEGSLDAAARCADRISEVAPQPALASVDSPPPQQHRTSAGDRGPLPPVGSNQRRAGPPSHQLQGSPPLLQERPFGQQSPLPR
jgi:hypothetical protein